MDPSCSAKDNWRILFKPTSWVKSLGLLGFRKINKYKRTDWSHLFEKRWAQGPKTQPQEPTHHK